MTLSQPALLVDLEQAQKNLALLQSVIPANTGIRIASKSIRCPELLRLFLGQLGSRARGVMCFHPRELAFLHGQGIDDLLLAYPLYNPAIADALAAHQTSLGAHQHQHLMVDSLEHLRVLESAARKHNTLFSVVIDIDVATSLPGLKFGVFRSSVRTLASLDLLLEQIRASKHLQLAGTMTYEAQVAGISDRDPRERWLVALVQRLLKRLARRRVTRLRQHFYDYLQKHGLEELAVLNGGGSGSARSTGSDSLVNELTLGSGILCPALFEHYDDLDLQPAIAFAIPVVRQPDQQHVTGFGGGYVASGAHSSTKQPRLLWPTGWSLVGNEGVGEVQTPLKKISGQAEPLNIGDSMFFVPAKSGETMERFETIMSASLTGNPPVVGEREFKTYRGCGVCFG